MAAILFVLVNLVRWGGSSRTGPIFVLGVAILLGLVLAFGSGAWWLLASRLPPGASTAPPRLAPAMRQVVGALIVGGGLMFSIGLLWDEIWHRRYGGFGDDFLWPPHMLLYSSMGIIAGIGVWGMSALRGSPAGLRERARAEPVITLLSLLALYLVVSAPSDALWHEIYGIDLTAWSLPHLLLFGGMSVVLLASILLLRSGIGPVQWRGFRNLRLQEALAIVVGGMAMSLMLQLGTAEWDDITEIIDASTASGPEAAFWNRPEWLYPVVLITIGFLVGNLMVHALRRVGAATLVGLVSLALRIVASGLFDGAEAGLGLDSQLLILIPLIVVDASVALRLVAPMKPVLGSLLAGATALAILLPIVAALVVYPRVNASTVPAMAGWGLVMAAGSTWLGAAIGDHIHTQAGHETVAAPKMPAIIGLLMAAAAIASAIAIASPPIT